MELTPLYEKTVKCPLCTHSFKTTKIRGRFIRVTGYKSDLQPVYQDPSINPNYYHISVCNECGYSFSDDFAPYFPPQSRERIDEKIRKQWNPQNFSGERSEALAISSYKLAVYCALLKAEKNITLAGLYLRLSWIYRSLDNADQQKRFQRLALQSYLQSYSVDDYSGTPMSTERLLYLIAELSLQLKDERQATQYFSKIIENQHSATEPKIVKMAKERWQDFRETRTQKTPT